MSHSHLFVIQEIEKHENSMRSAPTKVHHILATSYLKCLSNGRATDQRFWRNVEQKADAVFTKQLTHLRSLTGTERFCAESANFQRSIRQVHSSAPRAAHAALQQLNKIWRDAGKDQPVEAINKE